MSSAQQAQPVWASRTGQADHSAFLAFSESIADDAPFVAHDIAGSIAHVVGLHHAQLVSDEEATELITGLQTLADEFQQGTFVLEPALEDGHMNLEAALADHAGPASAKLHTGRSRNDQVATCITLYARHALAHIAQVAHDLSSVLQQVAAKHLDTPWVAETHGQAAQPASIGYLLAAHATRTQQLADEALQAFDRLATCPLGAGAVAGSTLPLHPEVPAAALGLAPVDHALVQTGTRDNIVTTTAVAAKAAPIVSALAADLMALHQAGLYTPPGAYTSGSSLMPHKRNPDALELVRGHGKALSAPMQEALDMVNGLGLGYHRDFQLTKPLLVKATETLTSTLHVLIPHITQGHFDAEAAKAKQAPVGIGATDAAEALVAAGIPFRDAYHVIATAMADVLDGGSTFPEALAKTDLDPATQAAASKAFHATHHARNTTGGPAPEAMTVCLEALAQSHHEQALDITGALQEVAIPAALLSTPAPILLDLPED